VAEGKVHWAFWPPDTDISCIEGKSSDGIWIPHTTDVDDNIDAESEEDESEPSIHSQETSEFEDQLESEEEGEVGMPAAGVGRFGALALDDDPGEAEAEDEDDSENSH
jgi:hypothetical protein